MGISAIFLQSFLSAIDKDTFFWNPTSSTIQMAFG